MELDHYDKDDNPCYGWDVYIQRISCYAQHKETVQEMSQYQDIDNPCREVKNENDTQICPDLHSLDSIVPSSSSKIASQAQSKIR